MVDNDIIQVFAYRLLLYFFLTFNLYRIVFIELLSLFGA